MVKKRAARTPQKRTKKRPVVAKAAKSKTETGLQKSKRGRGRPKKGESPLTPQVVDKIAQMYSRCRPEREIAKEVGVAHGTVHVCIEQRIKPVWRQKMQEHLGEDLVKVQEMEKAAWDKYEVSKDPADLAMARWAIEHRAKIAGHFAPTKLDMKQHAQVRIAGKSPDEFDRETIEIILQGIVERRQYQTLLVERNVET